VESRRVGDDTHKCSPETVDMPPAYEVAGPGLVRVCCAVTRLVQALNVTVPLAGQDLWPPVDSCHSDASRIKESRWDWGSGCGAP
jgi:hypothetical protein